MKREDIVDRLMGKKKKKFAGKFPILDPYLAWFHIISCKGWISGI